MIQNTGGLQTMSLLSIAWDIEGIFESSTNSRLTERLVVMA
jgi:hypothetical protein